MNTAHHSSLSRSFAISYAGGFGTQLIVLLIILVSASLALNFPAPGWQPVLFFVSALAIVSLAAEFAGMLARRWSALVKVILGSGVGLVAMSVLIVAPNFIERLNRG